LGRNAPDRIIDLFDLRKKGGEHTYVCGTDHGRESNCWLGLQEYS